MNVGAVVGGTVGGSILVLALGILLYRYWIEKEQSWLKTLPKEVRHFVDLDRLNSENDWRNIGDKSSACWIKSIKPGSRDWQDWQNMMEEMRGDKIDFIEVFAVINPLLVSSFANWRVMNMNRLKGDSAHLFQSESWKKLDRPEQRQFVRKVYEQKVAVYPWNHEDDKFPLLPVAHGTSEDVAFNIVKGGFVALASLDAGYYGKGIYFTTYVLYTIPYFVSKPAPAIIVSLACLGNPFPVVEGHQDPDSLSGQPTISGYQSHYVLTQKDGSVLKDISAELFYDEVVVNQEAQMVPIFIGLVDPEKKKKLKKLHAGDIRNRRVGSSYSDKKKKKLKEKVSLAESTI